MLGHGSPTLNRRKVRVNDTVITARLEEETVLLNVETGIYFGFDALGTRIWGLLAVGATEEEIFTQLLEEYDVAPERLRRDLVAFLDQLADKGLARIERG
jgi:hypothetical protein